MASKPKENKWVKAMELLKHSKLVGDKPELNKEREKKAIMEQINSGIYRTKYKTQKLRANTLKRAGGLMDRDSYFFMKGDAKTSFDKIKVISDPGKSASDSVVIVLVKGRQQFVMKLTFVDRYKAVEYNAPDTEARFYKIMETLVKKNITPHVFMLTDCLWESIPRTNIEANFEQFLRKYNTNKTHVYPIMTETGNVDSELTTLSKLIRDINTKFDYGSVVQSNEATKIIVNIMFQIIYTLHCFVKIDFKHNDLHLGNIFVLKRKQNKLDNPKLPEQFKRRYKFDLPDGTMKTVLLENIGLDVRIFDFDRSAKAKNKFRYHPEGLKSRFLRDFNSFGQNAVNNPHADIYKVMSHLRRSLIPRAVKNIIDSFFIQKSLMLDNKYVDSKGKTVKVLKRGYESYFLLDKKLPDGVLMHCNQALEVLSTHVDAAINSAMKNKNVFESFTTENIVESEKERVMKTIKSRPAKKPRSSTKSQAKSRVKSPNTKAKIPFKVKKASPKPKSPSPKKTKKKSPAKKVNVTCNDKTTKRSSIKTKNTNFEGKKRNRKMMDPQLKNCMLPFKFKRQMHSKCFDDGDGAICATERKPDCSIEKYAYCH